MAKELLRAWWGYYYYCGDGHLLVSTRSSSRRVHVHVVFLCSCPKDSIGIGLDGILHWLGTQATVETGHALIALSFDNTFSDRAHPLSWVPSWIRKWSLLLNDHRLFFPAECWSGESGTFSPLKEIATVCVKSGKSSPYRHRQMINLFPELWLLSIP